MKDWINIVLPIVTLIIGSLLTMLGQTLHDRRVADRKRRARREGFMTANFEVHRSAILEMQEVAMKCYKSFLEEKRRRSEDGGFYSYVLKHQVEVGMDFAERLNEFNEYLDHPSTLKRVNQMVQAIRSASSEQQREKLTRELQDMTQQLAEQIAAEMKVFQQRVVDIKQTEAAFEGLFPFWAQNAEFIRKLRMCMYRSGSNSVVYSGEDLIQSIYKWNDTYISDGMEILIERVHVAYRKLNRALSNALTSGPYDTYSSDRDD